MTKRLISVLLTVLSAQSVFADVTIHDENSNTNEWTGNYRNGNPPPSSPPQLTRKTGGHNGSAVWELSASGPSNFHYDAQMIFTGECFNPAIHGRMGQIILRLYNQAPSSAYAAATKPIAKQGNSYYTIGPRYEPPQFDNSWRQVSFSFHSSRLSWFAGSSGPTPLDQSPTAPPIYFGYMVIVDFNSHASTMYHRASWFDVQIQCVQNVSGRVTLEDCANPAQSIQLTFRPTNGSPVERNAMLDSDGLFSLTDIPRGNYTIHVKGSKWLAKNVNAVAGDVSIDIILLAGDANNDNMVDVLDLDALIQAFDTVLEDQAYNANADFNCDESVDVLDLDILIRNFDRQGDP